MESKILKRLVFLWSVSVGGRDLCTAPVFKPRNFFSVVRACQQGRENNHVPNVSGSGLWNYEDPLHSPITCAKCLPHCVLDLLKQHGQLGNYRFRPTNWFLATSSTWKLSFVPTERTWWVAPVDRKLESWVLLLPVDDYHGHYQPPYNHRGH